MPAVSPARKAAFQILMAVERGKSHSDDLLRAKGVNALTPTDRNLTTALVLGVLRWQIRLDHQLHLLLKRPNAKLDPEILIALRLGAFQLLHLDRIPARAAIDESVELAKQSGHRFASRMVNAVLRKLAVAKDATEKIDAEGGGGFNSRITPTEPKLALQAAEKGLILTKMPEKHTSGAKARIHSIAVMSGINPGPTARTSFSAACLAPEENLPKESVAELALTESHPKWMVERWASFYGLETARSICNHGQSQPVLSVRLASSTVEAELIEAGIQLSSGELLTAARTILSGDVTTTPAFHEGRVRVQDEGSQLIAELAASALDQNEQRILDSCAAPGGKTLILAERNPQARIVACESSAQRIDQLRERLTTHADRVECRLADATELTEDSVFDLALADVPCSGTGTLGRNPEIRHRLRPEDLPRQAERQRAILHVALRAVRTGGHVLYSTCSLEPEENEQVIAAVLAATPNVRQISLARRIESLSGKSILSDSGTEKLRHSLTPEGALRLLPGKFHTDGFFVALIEKTA
jgi:16S rRNA (cytosine967-C5)-methyltransferase